MFKRGIAIFLLIVMVGCMFVACEEEKSDYINEDEAIAIALKDMGITEEQASAIHVHVGTYTEQPCFNVYITYGSNSKTYVISSLSGEILSIQNGSGHSH